MPSINDSEGCIRSAALWIPVAYLNHHCVPNTFGSTIGDLYILRAADDLQAGTQLTVSYLDGELSFFTREQKLPRRLGQPCTCSQCQIDRAEGEASQKKRDDIYQSRVELMRSRMTIMARGGKGPMPTPEENLLAYEKIVRDMNATYPSGYGPIRFDLVEYQVLVGQQTLYAMRGRGWERQWGKAIRYGKDALRCLGVSLREDQTSNKAVGYHSAPAGLPILNPPKAKQEFAITCMLQMAGLSKNLGLKKAEKEWILAAYWVDQIITAPSKELFLERYKAVLTGLNAKAIDEATW